MQKRKVLIFADKLCLGEASVHLHKELMQDIIEAKIDRIITIGEYSKHLYNILPLEMRIFHAESVDLALPNISQHLKDQDVVVVQGSHDMKTEKIVAHLRSLHNVS